MSKSRVFMLSGLVALSMTSVTAFAALPSSVCSLVPCPVTSAPEIDPGSATTALTLLGGSLLVIRGARSKKK